MDEVEQSFEQYRMDPRPENRFAVVKALEPTISYTLNSLGAGSDPYMRTKARTFVASSLDKFDPSQSNLRTFASQQLQQLNREYRKRKAPMPVPERMQLDKMHVSRTVADFVDAHDREPTMEELSDRTQLPIKRLVKINNSQIGIGTEGMAESADMPAGVVSSTDWETEAAEYVYSESDTLDKKILEYKLGLYGTPKLDNGQILQKLKLKPYELSRRAMRLSKKINDILADLETV